jgi:hypothetical protein
MCLPCAGMKAHGKVFFKEWHLVYWECIRGEKYFVVRYKKNARQRERKICPPPSVLTVLPRCQRGATGVWKKLTCAMRKRTANSSVCRASPKNSRVCLAPAGYCGVQRGVGWANGYLALGRRGVDARGRREGRRGVGCTGGNLAPGQCGAGRGGATSMQRGWAATSGWWQLNLTVDGGLGGHDPRSIPGVG